MPVQTLAKGTQRETGQKRSSYRDFIAPVRNLRRAVKKNHQRNLRVLRVLRGEAVQILLTLPCEQSTA